MASRRLWPWRNSGGGFDSGFGGGFGGENNTQEICYFPDTLFIYGEGRLISTAEKTRVVTKSDVLNFFRCPRLACLRHSRPELAGADSSVFSAEGDLVEDFVLTGLAATLGTPVVTVGPGSHAERSAATARLLAGPGARMIRQASFLHGGVFVAVDALVIDGGGRVSMYEVKSSTVDPDKEPGKEPRGDKKTHAQFLDTLVQYRTLTGSGVRLGRVILVRLNKNARSPNWGDFASELDLTEYCKNMAENSSSDLEELIEAAREAVSRRVAAEVSVGSHCKAPVACPFFASCHAALPRHGVHTIRRLSPVTRKKFEDAGIKDIADIPASFKLSAAAARQRDAVLTGRPVIDRRVIGEMLNIQGPVAFIDFETLLTALPLQMGYGPWEQIVFQASVRITDEAGRELAHKEWIASKDDAEGHTVAASAAAFLEEALGGCRTVVSYNKSFECGRLMALARMVPSFEQAAERAVASMLDLLEVIEAGYYHPDFLGSLSIKRVLPVLVTGMSYEGLAVANGLDAVGAGRKLLFSPLSPDEDASLRAELKKYCGLDTQAMIEIFRTLRLLAAGTE